MSTRWNSSVAVEPSTRFAVAGILDAGQLDEDAVEALPLHDGLGHAELVDAIAQRHGVLLDREILALANRGLGQPHVEPGPAVDLRAVDDEPARELTELQELVAGVERANDLLGAVHVGRLDDRDLQAGADDADVVADFAFAELRAQVRLVRLEVLRDGRVEIDLVEKVHAAAQVEAEQHRLQPEP